ncbi:MAG: TetR/AcrR family transcriptional regulator [Ekhidna sp.]
MLVKLQLHLNPSMYLRDPQASELGKKIVSASITLISEMGFESFNFKKLSSKINSTEASVYRYFENKHRLLIYLIAWYWNYLEYRISFETHNISNSEEKLLIALKFITMNLEDDDNFPGISEKSLQQIVINESDKTYLTKHVDDDNKEGLFMGYKSLCKTIASYILEINPDYPYAHSLTSTCMEASHQQIFFALHLPRLSNISGSKDLHLANNEFLSSLILKAVKA